MKFIIQWEVGYGSVDSEVVDAENEDEAGRIAYERWRFSAEEGVVYSAEAYSEEKAEELGLNDE